MFVSEQIINVIAMILFQKKYCMKIIPIFTPDFEHL
jgi:hypothetical protein